MKRFFALFAILFPMAMLAQTKAAFFSPVHLTVNSENGVFAKGDTVKVYGQLIEPCDSNLEMKIYVNAGPRHYTSFKKTPEVRPVSLTNEKSLVYTAVFNEPTTIMLSVAPVGEKKLSSMIGFGVAPEEFRPGYEMPSDFVSYWDSQKKQLRKSKMKVTETPLDIPNAADAERFVAYSVELSMPEGNPARGYMVMPKNAVKKSLPIVLLVHSAGVSRKGCASSLSECLKYAKLRADGAIVFDLNAHGMLNGQPQEYYDDLEKNELKGYSTRPLESLKEFYFRRMYLREVRTMDYLCSLPEWNGRCAVVTGGSQGGGQSFAIAGLDSRITACCVRVPALTDMGASLQDRQCGWPSGYGTEADSELGRSILPYIDGAQFIKLTKANMFVSTGWVDCTCHASCVHAAYNVCPSANKCILDSPYIYHGGASTPDAIADYKIVTAKSFEFIKDNLK